MRFRIKRKQGQATIHFSTAVNADGHKQLCVIAECHMSGDKTEPVWGHREVSIRRALATLTQVCDCSATFHRAADFEGRRVAAGADVD